jgi:E3 ubiquitin-protein ligase BRE1
VLTQLTLVQALEKKLEECEGQNQSLKKELEATVSEWSEADAKISSLDTQLSKATKRSDELVQELEREQKERRKLQDSLDVAVRKAADATDKLNEIAKRDGGKGGGGDSSFTVEQLSTQVQVLKNRLACPVCHYRDKDCIIMRCRHMFCKHCVEENITVSIMPSGIYEVTRIKFSHSSSHAEPKPKMSIVWFEIQRKGC